MKYLKISLPAFLRRAGALAGAVLLGGCDGPAPRTVQGYVEGEYVYVSSPLAGTLQTLSVQRGAQVAAGDFLFALDDTPEKAAHDQAAEQLAQARASLEDAKKGRRPSEIASLQAQLSQANAALALANQDLARQEKLAAIPGGTAQGDLDRARSTRDQDIQRAAQMEADLNTAKLGSREDQIAAAEDSVRALQAALAKADWDLSQKRLSAPNAGLIFDTLYRPGEWVAAGRPVVSLLPPEDIKVRAFVSEDRVGAIHPGSKVRVSVDGTSAVIEGKVSFISPQAEYTPPVIYSKESRAKLMFLVEAVFDAPTAARLHPGQPVDIEFAP
jgi:HlyD family secretion protein